ncbi:MAG: hypothetical protein CME32_08715 [Gimesia sp.]|nr:hypothetical protein [Gimesia sp.]
MLRLLASTVLYVLGNAIGIVVAAQLLPGFSIDFWSIVIVAAIFTLIVVVITPLLIKISIKNVPQTSGGVALVAILVGLIGTSMFSDGLKISGLTTWILAPLIIWVVALIAGLVLPLFLFKKTLEKVKES